MPVIPQTMILIRVTLLYANCVRSVALMPDTFQSLVISRLHYGDAVMVYLVCRLHVVCSMDDLSY